MTSRERFEKAASEYGMIVRRHPSGNYLWSDTDVAWSFWQAAERQALERSIRVTAQAKTTSHACDAIRALMQGASNLTGKAREQWESDHYHRAIQDPEVCKMFGITPPRVASKEEQK